jgi:hypothetical protein
MDNSYKEKLSTLSMLVQLVNADNVIEDVELHFLIRVANKLEVKEEDYTQLFNKKFEFTPPQREVKRVVLFHNLLLLAYCDKHIDEKEIRFCYDIGLKLGLNTFAIHDILTKLKDQPQVGIDPFRVDRVFKRYYN